MQISFQLHLLQSNPSRNALAIVNRGPLSSNSLQRLGPRWSLPGKAAIAATNKKTMARHGGKQSQVPSPEEMRDNAAQHRKA